MNRTQAISHMLSGGKVKLDKSTYMYYDSRKNEHCFKTFNGVDIKVVTPHLLPIEIIEPYYEKVCFYAAWEYMKKGNFARLVKTGHVYRIEGSYMMGDFDDRCNLTTDFIDGEWELL